MRSGARPVRTIGVVTVARSDFSYYLPVLCRIQEDPRLDLRLYVSGMHLAPEFGSTVRCVEDAGFPIAERIPVPLGCDAPQDIASAMAEGVLGFARAFERSRPDLLLVLGDRFDMYPAALAALPFKIPVAHIGGGELTEGAIDDSLRHSMTKLSHLHLVERAEYARRIVQLGEEPWRVKVVGNPSLDNLSTMTLLGTAELSRRIGFDCTRPFLLVTFHPTTLEYEQAGAQSDELMAALHSTAMPVLFTMPNADTGGRTIIERIKSYVATHPEAKLVDNLGTQLYFSAMQVAATAVGNSSSGIMEAASFKLPVVNIGNRQKGRLRPANVIDVGYSRAAITKGIAKAVSPRFRASLRSLKNPFGDGHAAERIVKAISEVALNQRLLAKKFHDIPAPRGRARRRLSAQ